MLADRLRLPASTPHKPLAEARIALKKKLEAGDRVTCPCCGQNARLYSRRLRPIWAKALLALNEAMILNSLELSAVTRSNDHQGLAWWGLIESNAKGVWRLSDAGRKFVRGEIAMPTHALIYNGAFVGFDDTKMVTLRDLLAALKIGDDVFVYPTDATGPVPEDVATTAH